MDDNSNTETLESLLRERFADHRGMIASLSISADRVFLTFGDLGPMKRIVLQAVGNGFEIIAPQSLLNPPLPDDVAESGDFVPEDNKPSHFDTLYGSNVLPAMVEIAPGVTEQLGSIVALSHADSGLSLDGWNALADDDREARLAATVSKLKAEAEAKLAAVDNGHDGGDEGEKPAEPVDPDKHKKDELLAMAAARGLTIDASATKAEIAEALNAPKQ